MKYLFPASVLVSLVVHGLIAVVVVNLGHVRIPNALPKLELAHVELSVAETTDETEGQVEGGRWKVEQRTYKNSSVQPSTSNLQPPLLNPDSSVPIPLSPDTADLPKPDESQEQMETPRPTTQNSQPATSPAAAAQQASIDAPPKPRRNIRPEYPREARQRGEQGEGMLEIDISAQGTVDDVRVVQSSGFALLDEAAVKAFRAARFIPAESDGEAVPSTVRQPFKFKLQ